MLALVHWIGGLSLVTLVFLPAVIRLSEPARRLAMFEEIEGRFSRQAKISIVLAGLSGIFMTYRLDAWDRFSDPQFWWMHAMALIWLIFAFILFIGEPLFLHAWFRSRAGRDPAGAFRLVLRAHRILLALSTITIAGAVLGSQGIVF